MIHLRPAEIRVLSRHEKITPSQWAEKYRIVKKSSFPGPWRNRVTPYLTGIMDAFGDPNVREIWLMKGVQTGGTECAYNCLAWWMDRSSSNALIVMTDEKSVRRLTKGRLIPMITDSPKLAEIVSDNPDDTTIYQINLKTGASLHIGWASSQAAVASDPCEVVILDEVDKYTSGINLQEAKRRVTTFPHTSKIIALSTPGMVDGPIDQNMKDCDEIRDYHVPCPECGSFQPMIFEQFRWPQQPALIEGNDDPAHNPREIRRMHLAWYECPHCASRWDDNRRDVAVQAGTWVSRNPVDRPQRVGFHLPAWLSRFVPLSHVVAGWLEARHDLSRMRMWHNTMAGLPYDYAERDDTTLDRELYERREQYAPDGATWQIPAAALVLVCTVDVQDNRLEAEITAWGRGYRSWGIAHRAFPGNPSKEQLWTDVEEWAAREWQHENGHVMKCAVIAFDTGGHHTRESYYFIHNRRHRRMPQYIGLKGGSIHDAPLVKWSQEAKRKKKMALMIVGTNAAKDTISGWLREEKPGPGYMHFPAEYTYEWFRQLTAERATIQRDRYGKEKRIWMKKSPTARNEALDLRVYAVAVISWLNPDWNRLEEMYKRPEKDKDGQDIRPVPQKGRRIISKGVRND